MLQKIIINKKKGRPHICGQTATSWEPTTPFSRSFLMNHSIVPATVWPTSVHISPLGRFLSLIQKAFFSQVGASATICQILHKLSSAPVPERTVATSCQSEPTSPFSCVPLIYERTISGHVANWCIQVSWLCRYIVSWQAVHASNFHLLAIFKQMIQLLLSM